MRRFQALAATLRIFRLRIRRFPQTLPRKHPDFNLRLIQPTAAGRRVMDSEPIPDFRRHFRTKDICQCFAAMDVEVLQYQMDGLCFRVCQCQGDHHLGELKTRAIWRGEG
jgi:hypothetical protein